MPTTVVRRLFAVSMFVSFFIGLVSCGDITVGPTSATVGAACTVDTQCAEQCLVNDRHFPGGVCTVACAGDADCPGGSACIAEEGGVCVATCRSDADCAGFGRGFACDEEGRPDGSEAAICRVP
jgi:hypothetical protein